MECHQNTMGNPAHGTDGTPHNLGILRFGNPETCICMYPHQYDIYTNWTKSLYISIT